MKSVFYLELLTLEAIKVVRSNEKKIEKDLTVENVP